MEQSEADDQPQKDSSEEDAVVDHADDTVTPTAATSAYDDEEEDDDETDADYTFDGISPSVVDIIRPIYLEETVNDLTVIEIAALAGQREIVHYLRTLPSCKGVRSLSDYQLFFLSDGC
jgi:hypothetical protein